MLVSHLHRFIYTKTGKTGGTSVESYFERFCMPAGEWTLQHGRDEHVSAAGIVGYRGGARPEGCRWWNHMPAAAIREQLGEAIWDAYFKFCVVRNPYDKAVSAFYHLKGGTEEGRAALRSAFDLQNERAEFEKWVIEGRGLPGDAGSYLIDGRFVLDDVIRYESLAADLERICRRIGVPWNPDWLPAFKSGIRPAQATVGDLFTERAKAAIAARFRFEHEFFGYAFPA